MSQLENVLKIEKCILYPSHLLHHS